MSDVKEECNKIFKQLDEERSGSSEQLVTVSVSSLPSGCGNIRIVLNVLIFCSQLQGRIAEIVKVWSLC